MGCGASAAPAGYEPSPPAPEPQAAPAVKPEEVKVEGGGEGFVVAEQIQHAGDPKRPKKEGFLPFVRYDTASVPKEIKGGDHVYIVFTYSENALEGCGDGTVAANGADLTGACVFRCWRKDGTNSVFQDGDDVLLEHLETGKYLEAATDTQPIGLADRDENSSGQQFGLFKQGRPLSVKHRDTVYLQSWLHNYAEEKYFEGTAVYAKRWQRREPQTMTILKKAVLESTTTELARRFQFQAFDLDGNGSVSKSEMDALVCMVKGEVVSPEEIDEIMATADPALTGNIPFPSFASWADGGGLPEEQLQHVEVLGNIAQRCNDALHEESALIEVLTTIGTKSTAEMVGKYTSELKGGCVAEEIVTKASEQDGWIFSNYWKHAMAALLEPEVDLWVRCLNDAMKGWGTDEGTLTALVCTMPERLRVPIFQKYHETTGKNLLDHIKSETSCSYQKVMVWQSMAPEDCRATILNRAMVGLGTSEDQLIRVICALDFGERRKVKEAYERMFGRNLIEHIESETSGDFKKSLKCMLEATEAPFDIDADCAAMKEAMEGWGTDEEKLIQMICNKTSKQMEDVNKRFQELYDRDLLGWVKSETSGHFKDTLLGCIRHPMVQLAHSVRDCIRGWGTDDTGLVTCLVHLEDFKKAALIKTYRLEFKGRDLIKDIKSDTSGAYEKALCALVKPAPQVWAEALTGAMKGLGTADQLLINFMVLSKEDMMDVRKAFFALNGKMLEDWIDGDTSGDYKRTLLELAGRNSEDDLDIMPLYWAQRTLDAVRNIETVKQVLCAMPAVAIKRHTELYEKVYGSSLRDDIAKKCEEGQSWFSFSNYWKSTMLSLLDMPVERYVKGLYDAMNGWGTDEFTLTGLVCTIPENLYEDIHSLYAKNYGKKLVDHIESETSFNYKKALKFQAMPWAESRATALYGAMAGWGTAEDQLIRVVICSTMRERALIREAYKAKYGKDLIQHIKSETSGSFKNCLVAVLKSTHPRARIDFDADCDAIKAAMDGMGTDETAIIKIVAGKTPEQIETLKAKFEEKFGEDLYARIDDETWDWGTSIFFGANFRACMLGLMRKPIEALAYSVRDCIVGFGTDDTGLITLLTHLSERKRRDLRSMYAEIKNGGDLYKHIKGDTSGNYERALLAMVKPPPQVWAEALHGAMKGLGTSDNLLINWMCLSKDRMDEVREAFEEQYGQPLAQWIAGDCSGDYKDTLIQLANRKCMRFSGKEVGLSIAAPATKEDAVLRFTKTFNSLCHQRKQAGETIVPKEEDQQELGCAFLYFGQLSSCAPNLDMPGLWELTNAVGFPPADDGPDLIATFHEWNYSGSGEITWNDFVREMATRVNDPNHFEADPLPETIDQLETMVIHRPEQRAPEEYEIPDTPDSEPAQEDRGPPPGDYVNESGLFVDEMSPMGAPWRQILEGSEPCDEDGMLAGPWGDCLIEAVTAEHERGFDGACGHVIDFLGQSGHDAWMEAADAREQACHAAYG